LPQDHVRTGDRDAPLAENASDEQGRRIGSFGLRAWRDETGD
jgi:hypothetical protein